jgi:predicted acyltransferase
MSTTLELPTQPTSGQLGPLHQTNGRVMALDVFRGIALSAMILVNNPGSPEAVFPALRHSAWHGCTLADLVFPFFIFSLGASLALSLHRRLRQGEPSCGWIRHAAIRTAILVALGLILNGSFYLPWSHLRWAGVLQRIGVVYFLTAVIASRANTRTRAVTSAAILLGYGGLLLFCPAPGCLPGDLSPHGNIASYLDRMFLAGHMWQPEFDPEGLLSTLPALASCLLGTIAGERIADSTKSRSGIGHAVHLPPKHRPAAEILTAGLLLIALGATCGLLLPLNKALWTTSFALFTTGLAAVVLALCLSTTDTVLGRSFSLPFAWQGRNAILIYFTSEVLAMALLGDVSEQVSQSLLAGWLTPAGGSLAWSLAYAVFWMLIAGIMHRRRIFIKI